MIIFSDSFFVVIVAFYVLFVTIFFLWLTYRRKNTEKRINTLLPKIFKRMLADNSFGREELLSLYEDNLKGRGYYVSFVHFLQTVCNYLSLSEIEDGGSGSSAYRDSILDATCRIKSILAAEKETVPFDEHDTDVRYLMKDIAKGIEEGEKGFARERLSTLSEVIKIKEGKYRKDHSITRWSFYIALAGAFISILLGIISLNKKVHLAESDMDELKEVTLMTDIKAEVKTEERSLPLNLNQ